VSEVDRARATTPPRLGVIITATLLGGMIAAVGLVGSDALEPRLTQAAESALSDAGISGVGVRFDGREAFLSSTGASAAQLAQAERVIESVDGVRWATVVEPDQAASPTLTVVQDADGSVTVTGTVGTAAQASAVQDAAVAAFGPGTVAELDVVDGVPTASWTGDAPDLFAALAQVGDLGFAIAADGATLTGTAVDPDAVEALVADAIAPLELTATLEQSGPTPDEAAVINGTVIRFTSDSVTLDAEARAKAAELADALRRFPDIGVTLTGHIAIPVGSEDDAVAFSLQRAQAVADALIADGIAADRIEIAGAGSSQPVGDNSTDEGAAANRRVTVLIMEGS
jgi:outer membrane protein OmpA-like peptidoglycan-associated protein